MENEIEKISLKVCILGDHNVGKTSICKFLVNEQKVVKDENAHSTFGLHVYKKSVTKSMNWLNYLGLLKQILDDKEVNIEIFDTNGSHDKNLDQLLFKTILIILVFDLTNLSSISNLEVWLKKIQTVFLPKNSNSNSFNINAPLICVLGNKIDLGESSTHELKMLKKISLEYGITHFFNVSALTGSGIDEAFNTLLTKMLRLKGGLDFGMQNKIGMNLERSKPRKPRKEEKVNYSVNEDEYDEACIVQ